MADISKADLKKEIAEILEGADLTTTTAKKVRQQVEEKLKVNLGSRKKEIDEIVMQCLEDKQSEKKGKGKKNGKAAKDDDDDEEEEEDDDAASDAEEDEEDEESEEEKPKKRAAPPKKAPAKRKKADSDDDDEEASDDDNEKDDDYSPAKKKKGAPKKKSKAAGKKGKGKKKGSDSDSDEDWGKKKKPAAAGGAKKKTGYGKDCNLSPDLAAIVGSDVMPRHEVVKRIWAYIKEKNLYDPTNKQFCVCDADLQKVMGVKKFRAFGMMKYLKTHFLS